MQTAQCHRLFMAIVPPAPVARRIFAMGMEQEPEGSHVRIAHLHATIAISNDYLSLPRDIVESWLSVGAHVRANPFEFILNRMSGRTRSVALMPSGRVKEFHDLAASIRDNMTFWGVEMREGYRLSPHVTLYYKDGAAFSKMVDPVSWQATELFLIHSHVGLTQHDVIGRWPLRPAPVAQASLFGDN